MGKLRTICNEPIMLYEPQIVRKRVIKNYFLPHKDKSTTKYHRDFLSKYFDKDRFIRKPEIPGKNLHNMQETNIHVEKRDSI